jgi:hypothetical protein
LEVKANIKAGIASLAVHFMASLRAAVEKFKPIKGKLAKSRFDARDPRGQSVTLGPLFRQIQLP